MSDLLGSFLAHPHSFNHLWFFHGQSLLFLVSLDDYRGLRFCPLIIRVRGERGNSFLVLPPTQVTQKVHFRYDLHIGRDSHNTHTHTHTHTRPLPHNIIYHTITSSSISTFIYGTLHREKAHKNCTANYANLYLDITESAPLLLFVHLHSRSIVC